MFLFYFLTIIIHFLNFHHYHQQSSSTIIISSSSSTGFDSNIRDSNTYHSVVNLIDSWLVHQNNCSCFHDYNNDHWYVGAIFVLRTKASHCNSKKSPHNDTSKQNLSNYIHQPFWKLDLYTLYWCGVIIFMCPL